MLSVYTISCFKLLMASYFAYNKLKILFYSLQGQTESSCELPIASKWTSLCSRLPPAVLASPVWCTHHTDPALLRPSAGQLWIQRPRLPPLRHPGSHPLRQRILNRHHQPPIITLYHGIFIYLPPFHCSLKLSCLFIYLLGYYLPLLECKLMRLETRICSPLYPWC